MRYLSMALAIELLSQAWLSDQPDVRLLTAAMALEVLLAESSDQENKVRLARRASYFACGAPNIGDCCQAAVAPPARF